MPKITKYPRLRTKIYRGRSGQAYVYYVYDMRPEGKPDIRLGKDYESAIAQWEELHNHRPLTIGRLADSPALSAIVERREAMQEHCIMLLCTNTGREVSMGMLRDRWDEARDKAALVAEQAGDEELGQRIRAMFLRDMRSLAADLAADVEEASKLLQHSNKAITEKHYRTRAQTIKPVR